MEYVIDNYQPPLYNDPNGKLISTLTSVYNEVTGDNAKPIAIGGGTYARALKCGCAFGPEMQGDEATIHQANEYVTFAQIERMSEIYYKAIKAVCVDNDTECDCDDCDCDDANEGDCADSAKNRVAVITRSYKDKEPAPKQRIMSITKGFPKQEKPARTKLATVKVSPADSKEPNAEE